MTSIPNLGFITFFSIDPQSTANFYGKFGIVFRREKHGTGPTHFAFENNGIAVELYPATDKAAQDARPTLLGFEVPSAEEAAQIATANEFEIIEPLKTTSLGERLVVVDPDGRHVFFYSKTSKE
jgi:lactoylglutathione lyase